MNNRFLWDRNRVRYFLVKESGGPVINTFFFPGGPGMDSSYLFELATQLEIPGNIWLFDFPGNGSNEVEFRNYDAWPKYLLESVDSFENVVIIGHSFGALFPLLNPALEDHLHGFIVLDATPTDWRGTLKEMSKIKHLPSLDEYFEQYQKHPSKETFMSLFKAFAPYFFTPNTIKEGLKLIEELPFNDHVLDWWNQRSQNYSATWVPKKVPTLIIGGTEDSITPPKLFAQDQRFAHIPQIKIEGASHFCWLERSEEVRKHIEKFYRDHLMKLKNTTQSYA